MTDEVGTSRPFWRKRLIATVTDIETGCEDELRRSSAGLRERVLALEHRQKSMSMPQRPIRPLVFNRLFTVALVLLTISVFALALSLASWPDLGHLWVVVWVVVAMIAAIRFPLPASTQDSTTLLLLDTCVVLAAALLLDPPIAMLAVAAGALVGELSHRRPGQRIVANTAQMALQAGAAGLVVLAASAVAPDAARLSVVGLCTLVGAGLAMHIVNSLAIAIIIYLDADEPFLSIWVPMLHYFDIGQRLGHIGQWAIALITVVLVDAHPLGFLLLLIPVVALYTMQLRYNQLLRQVQKTLRGTEASQNAAQRIAQLGSWEWELAHDTWHWSDELYRIIGFAPRAFPASRTRYLETVHAGDRARVTRALERVSRDGVAETLDYRVSRQDGIERVVHVRIEPMLSASGEIQTVIGAVLDVTERKQLETRLSHQAHHDPLTGLSNRAHFLDRLDASRREAPIAVLFIDLDNFKQVNDRLGHDAGDRVLCVVAERLRHCLRDGDLAGRQGGDEFTVLLQSLTSPNEAERVAQRILRTLSEPIVIDGQSFLITPSIGVAITAPDLDTTAEELLRAADMAMYRAKRGGKAGFAVFGVDDEQDIDAATLAMAS
jgi:diguanylate cyclase (GGDEF)-like protein/PAS domain S-box-containing protein